MIDYLLQRAEITSEDVVKDHNNILKRLIKTIERKLLRHVDGG